MSDRYLQVLLVEDSPGDAALLEMSLTESVYGNFQVTIVRRLDEAISRLSRESFDAILLDRGLPESQGLQTLQRMRPRAANAPIIVLTGLSDENLAIQAMKEGAQDYLVKSEVERGLIGRAVRYVIERTRAERASVDAERRLQLAVEAAQIGIWDWDLKRDTVVWSPIQAQLLGIQGRDCSFEAFDRCIHPNDRLEVHKTSRDAITSQEPFRIEYRVVWPDGTLHWLEGRGRAFFDDDGKASRMMGTIVEITQRKAADEAAKTREADLAHLSRVSTMGQMASGLAHELNQPLGAILSYGGACLAQMDDTNQSLTTVKTGLEEMMNETRRAGLIVTRMREFVQKRQPKTRPVDLNQIVQRSLQLLQFDLDRHTIAADVDLVSDLPQVLADDIQIEQVLVNLICNAIEAIAENPAGPRKISVQTERQQDSNQVWVTVIDSGAGMSDQNIRQLFDPFFTTKPNGLGMGLNISRSIIESHGGRLTASANPDGGMRFRFTLPIETGVAPCPTNSSR